MAKHFQAHMFESGGAFIARVGGLGMFRGRALTDLRSYVITDAARAWSEKGGQRGQIEFRISAALRAKYPVCAMCGGRGRVGSDRVGVQSLNAARGFDWSVRATDRCDACEGTGADVPGFGEHKDLATL